MKKGIVRYILIVLGFIFLALGFVGVVVPVLPTVPFMLLAAICFVKSSDRLYNWVVSHKHFGPPVRSYLEHKALSKSAKIKAVTTIWISLIISALIVQKLNIALILLVTGILLSAYLLSIKTLSEEGA